jgi:hypothetical protein
LEGYILDSKCFCGCLCQFLPQALDETDWDQNRERPTPDLENENHQANVDFYKTQCSPLSEDEIDQLLKNHVTAQVKAGLQCSHSQECVSEISSIIENENLGLNDDSHETDETIQEVVVSKPICDVDFLQGDQLTRIVFFHEEDRADMFNNLEECFLFKDDLDYEMEEYESEIDSMPEIESELLMLEEFTANTQVAESHTSLCLPMDQQPSILSDQNERSTCIFVGFQDKVTFQFLRILTLICCSHLGR